MQFQYFDPDPRGFHGPNLLPGGPWTSQGSDNRPRVMRDILSQDGHLQFEETPCDWERQMGLFQKIPGCPMSFLFQRGTLVSTMSKAWAFWVRYFQSQMGPRAWTKSPSMTATTRQQRRLQSEVAIANAKHDETWTRWHILGS